MGLLVISTVVGAIAAVLLALLFAASATAVFFSLVVAGLSILVGALLAFVIEFFHIREALAGLIRFAGRVLLEALRAVWDHVRSAWSWARAMAAN